MRLKSLLLLFILTQFLCVAVFGKSSEDKVTPQVELKDSIQAKNARAVAPASVASAAAQPSTGRDNAGLADGMSSRKSIFYSNAKIYVADNKKDDGAGGKVDDASIFILGTAKFDNAAQLKLVGEASLTGDFVSVKDNANIATRGKVASLFDHPDDISGVVRFSGKWNTQHIVREKLTGERMPNNPLDNTLKIGGGDPSNTGWEYILYFPTIKVAKDNLTTVQQYKDAITQGAAGNPSLKYDVEKMGFVSVNSNVAMSINKLDMRNGNRFSIDAVSYGLEKKDAGVADADIAKIDYYRLQSAYVDVRKLIADGDNAGYSEVNLKMYDASSDKRIEETNEYEVKLGSGDKLQASFLRGFTSPFNKLRSDYMFYHVLTIPTATSITGWEGPVSDPKEFIEAGRGYFMGMDVSRQYYKEIKDKWHASNPNAADKRARGGYNWSRVAQRMKDFTNNNNSDNGERFSLYTFDKADALADAGHAELTRRSFEDQRFNVGEVKVHVYGPGHTEGTKSGQGLNFLGNPFMMPINISSLLAKFDRITGKYETKDVEKSEAKLTEMFEPYLFSSNVRAVHAVTPAALQEANSKGWLLLRSKYWITHSALVANTTLGGQPAYAYNVKYDNVVAVNEAATPSYANVFDMHLEPMQMFLIQAANSGDFIFTDAMKTFTGKSFPIQFYTDMPVVPGTKSSASATSSNQMVENNSSDYYPSDWLVVEAIAGDARKASVDRTAVRFFQGASLGIDKFHDNLKNLASPNDKNQANDKPVAVESMSNFVYTTAATGEKLLSNGVGYGTRDVPLHYYSNGEVQNVTFAITGVEGFDKVEGVSLVDRWVNGDGSEYVKEITDTDYTYQFTTTGNEKLDGENRFFLRFGADDGNTIITDDPITCYYSGSTLHIGGLNKKDLGSLVQIFDLQGRLMGNTTINNYPNMDYPKPLGQGTFIVNISGERSYKTKFVNLQNY